MGRGIPRAGAGLLTYRPNAIFLKYANYANNLRWMTPHQGCVAAHGRACTRLIGNDPAGYFLGQTWLERDASRSPGIHSFERISRFFSGPKGRRFGTAGPWHGSGDAVDHAAVHAQGGARGGRRLFRNRIDHHVRDFFDRGGALDDGTRTGLLDELGCDLLH